MKFDLVCKCMLHHPVLPDVIDLEGNGIRVRVRRVPKANEDKKKVHQNRESKEESIRDQM